MNTGAYLLVFASALAHAYWNFLLKRAHGGQVFIALSKVSEVVLFFPPFAYLAINSKVDLIHGWPLYVVAATLALLNYVFLAMAYAKGKLTIVYPVSRAGILLFLPILAYYLVGERISPVGGIGLSAILVGVAAMQLTDLTLASLRETAANYKSSASMLALSAALAAAGYTLWDKHSVAILPPFIYLYAYTFFVAFAYVSFVAFRHPWPEIQGEWKAHRSDVVQVGFLNIFGYLLVLLALQIGNASYVIALRQLSIGIGVFLGAWLLKESVSAPQKVGTGLLLVGSVIVSAAR